MVAVVRFLFTVLLVLLLVFLQCLCQLRQDKHSVSSGEEETLFKEAGKVEDRHRGVSTDDNGEVDMEGASFKRYNGRTSLLGGGLFSGRGREEGSTPNYPLYEVSPILDRYHSSDVAPGYFRDDGFHLHAEDEYNQEEDIFVEEPQESYPSYSHSSFPYTPLTRQRREPRYHSMTDRIQPPRYNNGGSLFGGLTGNYHSRAAGPSFSEMCCADCPDRSISCLALCKRTGCKRVGTCASAGKGAYAAFCQSRCQVMMGMSMASVEFLPDEACRGYCSANVQKLCAANSCTDHGCYARECADLAPMKCL